ncbi:MAG TPA: (d)CMP kinase [Gemmataceae bacterium]|jgi:cytidylate kinase|nr:(d)CMP kinase [Gemmataceae bacterium]
MIITIDGPAGSGKSSAAKALAKRLGFEMLDTGATYRAVALAIMRAGIDSGDEQKLRQLLNGLRIEMPPQRVILNGEDITGAIRTPEISAVASKAAAIGVVREYLVGLQRAIAHGRNMVCEGRDQGTVVFPDAARKFFFTADREERARRRLKELLDKGGKATLESILAEQDARDLRDASRDISPMTPAPDAIIIDTTDLSPEQVLDVMEREIRPCMSA